MLKVKINSLLDYIQPTKYIVSSEEYSNEFNTPVLTAGDTFLLGYTNDKDGIYNASKHNPIILFDDFTTAIKWVDFPFKVKSSACKIIVSKTKTNLRYCYYAMKAMNFDHLQHKRYWISEYSEQLINDYEDENSKIVAELDNITDTISKKEQVILNLDELIKSRFIEMFGDIDNKPSRWTIAKIQDIAKCVAGATPSTSRHEYWENGTIPWLSSGEVNKYRIYETNTKITRLGYDSTSTKLVPPHTVVLAMAGQGKTRGTAAMAEIELCTNQSICSLVTNKKMNPDFLLFYLKEQYEQLRAASNGEGGRGGLNLKIIGAFPIMVPPIELQNKFAAFVEQVDKSKFIVQKEIKDLQELLDKKMDEYFGQ